MSMKSFLYESLNTTLIQAIQCKYLLKSISKMQLRVQLCIFQYKRMKNAIKVIKIISLYNKHKTQAKQDTKTKRLVH